MDGWIFANGELDENAVLRDLISRETKIIAADGGLKHIRKLNLIPDFVIGDMDSVTENEAEWLKKNKIAIARYPESKDETDLELAINYALASGLKRIRIAGATGGRADQFLGNIFLLLRDDLVGVDIRIDDGLEEICLVRSEMKIEGKRGDILSLIPVMKPAEGITTEGLAYPLVNETLFPQKTRGISNVMLGDTACVSVKKGLLICVHIRKEVNRNDE
jgi:thiamine pyrophosphokinase